MPLEIETSPGRTVLRLNAPPLNLIGRAMYQELLDALDALAKADDVGLVVLTGTGFRAFSAGADLAEIKATPPEQAEEFAQWRRWAAHEVVHRLEALPQATVAAVNGVAIGIGCMLVSACDFRIAAAGASFSLPEIKLGALGGVAELRPLNLASGWHRYLVLTGEAMDCATALTAGLVQRMLPKEDLASTVDALTTRMLGAGVVNLRRSTAALRALAVGGAR